MGLLIIFDCSSSQTTDGEGGVEQRVGVVLGEQQQAGRAFGYSTLHTLFRRNMQLYDSTNIICTVRPAAVTAALPVEFEADSV
jgi:hypothetical protein